MAYDMNLFSHLRAVSECLTKFDARARIDFETLNLLIRGRGRQVELLPQFMCRRDGGLAYTPRLAPDVRGFVGWRPYFNRVWPSATDKVIFKDFCANNGLRTPHRAVHAADVHSGVLVKRSRSSFGRGMSGPFTADAVKELNYVPREGEYFEQFVHGDIAKIWYWNDQPASLEIIPMPAVVGDGRSTLRDLIANIKSLFAFAEPNQAELSEALARYQGLTLDSVPQEGQRVLVDFRYQSTLHPTVFKKVNMLKEYEGTRVLEQLADAGREFWNEIPEQFRPNIVYTIDAIVDAQQDVWFLEMNCNPLVHPDVYPMMIESLLVATTPQFLPQPEPRNVVPGPSYPAEVRI
jgi:hypothetical protein